MLQTTSRRSISAKGEPCEAVSAQNLYTRQGRQLNKSWCYLFLSKMLYVFTQGCVSQVALVDMTRTGPILVIWRDVECLLATKSLCVIVLRLLLFRLVPEFLSPVTRAKPDPLTLLFCSTMFNWISSPLIRLIAGCLPIQPNRDPSLTTRK